MSISIAKQGDCVIVGIPDQLVRNNRLQLKRKVDEQVSRGERTFLLDFSKTNFIDSSGHRPSVWVVGRGPARRSFENEHR